MRLAILACVAGWIVLIWLVAASFRPLDDTDDHITESRSGLGLYTDHGTGCQYLSASGSGITARLDAKGKHICSTTTERLP